MNANALMQRQMREMQRRMEAQRQRQLQAAAYFHLQEEIARRSRPRVDRAPVRARFEARIPRSTAGTEPGLGHRWRVALLVLTLGVVAVALAGG